MKEVYHKMPNARLESSADLSVCDPLQKALIQQHYGYKLTDAPKEVLRHLVDQFKAKGNAAFRQGRYQGMRVWAGG